MASFRLLRATRQLANSGRLIAQSPLSCIIGYSPRSTGTLEHLRRHYHRQQKQHLSTASIPSSSPSPTMRLSKLLSHPSSNLGLSRREAERCIKEGHVTVAGKTVTSPSQWILLKEHQTAIKVDNQHLVLSQTNPELDQTNTKVWVVHKLPGEIVSEHDPHGRPSMLDRLSKGGVGRKTNSKHNSKQKLHLKPVGRLDVSSEGLILVTNDGTYARQLELPRNQVHRTYRVRVHGLLTKQKLDRIRKGMTVDGVHYRGMRVVLDAAKGKLRRRSSEGRTNMWLRLTCTEGKNRQVRKVLSYLGLTVMRLIRVSYGDYQLQTIPPGMAIEVPVKPFAQLKHKGSLQPKSRNENKKGKANDPETMASPVQWIRHSTSTTYK